MNHKIIMYVVLLFVVFMVFTNPVGAAAAASKLIDWVLLAATSVGEFITVLAGN